MKTFEPVTKITGSSMYPVFRHDKTGCYRLDTYCDKCKAIVDFYTFMMKSGYYCQICGAKIKRCKLTKITKKEFTQATNIICRAIG